MHPRNADPGLVTADRYRGVDSSTPKKPPVSLSKKKLRKPRRPCLGDATVGAATAKYRLTDHIYLERSNVWRHSRLSRRLTRTHTPHTGRSPRHAPDIYCTRANDTITQRFQSQQNIQMGAARLIAWRDAALLWQRVAQTPTRPVASISSAVQMAPWRGRSLNSKLRSSIAGSEA